MYARPLRAASAAFLGCAGFLASSALGQNLVSYTTAGAAAVAFNEQRLPAPAYAAAAISRGLFGGAPPRAFSGHPNGGVAIDNTTGIVYATDGVTNITRTHYPHVGCGAVPGPLPPMALPIAGVTGLCIDPATKHLYLTDGAAIFETDAVGVVIAGPWFAPAGLPQLTGLEFGSWGALIFAVAANATVVTFNLAGGVVAVVAPAYAPAGLGPATGIALDNSVPAAPLPYVIHAGGAIYHHATGAMLAVGPVNHQGLAFAASTLFLPDVAGCTPSLPAVTNSMAYAGNAAFAFRSCAMPAGSFGLLGVSFGGPGACIAGTGTQWIAIPPAGAYFAAPVGGVATVGFPLPAWAAGLWFTAQWVVMDPAAGPRLTNGLHVEICIP